MSNGDTYSGNFSENMFNGQGDYVWKNGNHYNGDFSNGLMDGQGHGVVDIHNGGDQQNGQAHVAQRSPMPQSSG